MILTGIYFSVRELYLSHFCWESRSGSSGKEGQKYVRVDLVAVDLAAFWVFRNPRFMMNSVVTVNV